MKKIILFSFTTLIVVTTVFSQKISNDKITEQIALYKESIRGPYNDVLFYP